MKLLTSSENFTRPRIYNIPQRGNRVLRKDTFNCLALFTASQSLPAMLPQYSLSYLVSAIKFFNLIGRRKLKNTIDERCLIIFQL